MITYIYTIVLWIVVVKRMKHKLELRKRSFGVSDVKGLEGRVISFFEKGSEKRGEGNSASASVGITEIKQ